MRQLVASLGTPFAFAPPKGHVLFLEDVTERPYSSRPDGDAAAAGGDSRPGVGDCPGRISRVRRAGRSGPLARATLAGLLKDFNGPVLYGFPSGHTAGPLVTLPFGVKARVVAGATPRLVIEEAGVA